MKKVELSKVSVHFGKVHALREVDLSVGAGEVVMLVGPNGAGKSTLMKVLLGLVRPNKGTLRVDGVERSLRKGVKEDLGYLPEAVAFSESLTGRQVLRFFSWARGVKKKRLDAVLRIVGLEHAANRRVRGYSRGMRQRLGIGVAILAEPELLVLDEPTGGLDQEGISVLFRVLEEWRNAGRMVLLASHDLALLERRVDRICLLSAGRMHAEGTPESLRRRTSLPHRVTFDLAPHANGHADAIVEAVSEIAGVVTRDHQRVVVEVDQDELVTLMNLQAGYPDLVERLRVEEPQLDEVYEQLLEEP